LDIVLRISYTILTIAINVPISSQNGEMTVIP